MEISNLKGNIFDIRRFSTHDGDGLRTTVFFKGCNLLCVWCQNPEGIPLKRMPMYLKNNCIHCKTCLKLSKNGGIYEEDGNIRLRRETEEDWDLIVYECPSGAIIMDSKTYTINELVKEIEKDKIFFSRGGGVTLSGGEPLMQGEFAVNLLKTLHERGINTAVETALNVPEIIMKKALPYLDVIFADIKIMNEDSHKKYVGASNTLIKSNLAHILTSKYKDKVIIRTPLIPNFTATEENLGKIAEFVSGLYPEIRYELLNYNPLAEAKYHLIDQKYCFEDNPKLYTKEQMISFGNIVKTHGIKNLIMEMVM